MPREIREFLETWQDRVFVKSVKRLRAKEKATLEARLEMLYGLLSTCRHPITDPQLATFQPTPYWVALRTPGIRLAEYRLGPLCRVVAAYFENTEDILLIAISVDHDHPRLKVLVKKYDSAGDADQEQEAMSEEPGDADDS